MRIRILAALSLLAILGALAAPAAAHNEGIPSVPVASKNMTHLQNIPNLSGNALDFFERKLADGTVKRYAVAATQGNGFDILDLADPAHPKTVGRYLLPGNDPNKVNQSSAGLNFHAWVSVNPVRNIVALTTEEGVGGVPIGRTVRHSGTVGIQFVDISDVTNPKPLGKLDGLDGPHTVRMIGNNHAYTSLNTHVVDYSDPMNPKSSRKGIEGHEFYEDPNIPGRMYVGLATSSVGKWGTFNVASPGDPAKMGDLSDTKITAAHEVYPAPDSSYVGVSDFTSGQSETSCPGGGLHFYDISGKRVSGASVSSPAKLGTWHMPFTGLAPDGSSTNPNYISCALHSWNHQPERSLAVAGFYAGGTWVFDPSGPTKAGGAYAEYSGARGKTSWGNTLANFRDAADYVNATQFLPFDLANPEDERLVYVNGWERGLDVYRYTGPMPAKQSRIRVDSATSGGNVTGTLERFAVLTHQGWRNVPLADKTVEISAGGQTVTTVTRADGSFAAPLALGAGSNAVTVRWDGEGQFGPSQVTRSVTG